MSSNINQVFISNPATSMQDDDLIYLGRSPYGLTDDMAILWSDMVNSINGNFLQKANNFTDVSNPGLAFQNLGTGTGLSITITDSDFSAGVYQIPVPFPAQVVCNVLATPGQQIRLPVANTPFDSPALGQGPIIKMINCVSTDIALSNGSVIDSLVGFDQSKYICSNKATAHGAYNILPEVYLVNSKSGRIDLSSDNLEANNNFTPVNYTPTAGSGWGASTITGNLAGIDAKLAGGGGIPANVLLQQLWVNDASGNDSNDGGLYTPFKTINAARGFAALTASPSNRFLINVIGNASAAGIFYINPYIDWNFQDCRVSCSDIQLDASFTVSNEHVKLVGFHPFGGGIPLTITFTAGDRNSVTFINSDFSDVQNGTVYATATAGGNNGFSINNDVPGDPQFPSFTFGLTIIQVNSSIRGVNFNGRVTYDLLDNGFSNLHYLDDCQMGDSVILDNSAATTSAANFIGSNILSFGTAIFIKDAAWQVYTDGSFYRIPISGTGTYSNVFLFSSTDTVGFTQSFVPVNYSFVAGGYPNMSSSGWFAGIDTVFSNIYSVMTFTMVGSAVNSINANNAITNTDPSLEAIGLDSNINFNIFGKGNGGVGLYSRGVRALFADNPPNAVNYIGAQGSATGGMIKLSALGTDTDITINVESKGTGRAQIKGIGTNTTSPAGYIGEFQSATNTTGSPITFSTGTAKTLQSLTLGAGDWDVWGNIFCSGTTVTSGQVGLSTTNNTQPDNSLTEYSAGLSTAGAVGLSAPAQRFLLSTSTTIYIVGTFTGTGTLSCSGGIYARRRS